MKTPKAHVFNHETASKDEREEKEKLFYLPIAINCAPSRASDGTYPKLLLESISWALIDAETHQVSMEECELICLKSDESRAKTLRAALKKLDARIGKRNVLFLACGPMALRQYLHPALAQNSIDLGELKNQDAFFKYVDLNKEFNFRYSHQMPAPLRPLLDQSQMAACNEACHLLSASCSLNSLDQHQGSCGQKAGQALAFCNQSFLTQQADCFCYCCSAHQFEYQLPAPGPLVNQLGVQFNSACHLQQPTETNQDFYLSNLNSAQQELINCTMEVAKFAPISTATHQTSSNLDPSAGHSNQTGLRQLIEMLKFLSIESHLLPFRELKCEKCEDVKLGSLAGEEEEEAGFGGESDCSLHLEPVSSASVAAPAEAHEHTMAKEEARADSAEEEMAGGFGEETGNAAPATQAAPTEPTMPPREQLTGEDEPATLAQAARRQASQAAKTAAAQIDNSACLDCLKLKASRQLEAVCLLAKQMLKQGHKFTRIESIKRGVEIGLCESNKIRDNENRIVKARGLPWQATEQDIANFFTGLDISRGGVALCLSRQGRRNGEAIIQFETREQRNLALGRHKHFMGNRYIEIYRASGEEFLNVAAGYNQKAQAFLSKGAQVIIRMRGLPFTCSAKQVIEFFQSSVNHQSGPAAPAGARTISVPGAPCDVLGGEEGILFVRNQDDKPTGDAFVLFASEEMAQKALAKHRLNVGPRYVELFRSTISEVQQVLSVQPGGCQESTPPGAPSSSTTIALQPVSGVQARPSKGPPPAGPTQSSGRNQMSTVTYAQAANYAKSASANGKPAPVAAVAPSSVKREEAENGVDVVVEKPNSSAINVARKTEKIAEAEECCDTRTPEEAGKQQVEQEQLLGANTSDLASKICSSESSAAQSPISSLSAASSMTNSSSYKSSHYNGGSCSSTTSGSENSHHNYTSSGSNSNSNNNSNFKHAQNSHYNGHQATIMSQRHQHNGGYHNNCTHYTNYYSNQHHLSNNQPINYGSDGQGYASTKHQHHNYYQAHYPPPLQQAHYQHPQQAYDYGVARYGSRQQAYAGLDPYALASHQQQLAAAYATAAAAAAGQAHQHQQNQLGYNQQYYSAAIFHHQQQLASLAAAAAAAATAAANANYHSHQHPMAHQEKRDCIRLRGLPFEAQVDDVLKFLGAKHSKNILYQGIHMVYSAHGQPSGEAVIQMNSSQAAQEAAQEFHRKVMSVGKKQRYIEVLPCSIDDMLASGAATTNGSSLPPAYQQHPLATAPPQAGDFHSAPVAPQPVSGEREPAETSSAAAGSPPSQQPNPGAQPISAPGAAAGSALAGELSATTPAAGPAPAGVAPPPPPYVFQFVVQS